MEQRGDLYDAALGARTQSLFRDVNERVREINATFAEYVPLGDWICECAENGCAERIALTTEEYEQVRADATTFAIAPGQAHVFEEIEEVVRRTDRYWVVQKSGKAGELVERVDPRRVGLRGSRQSGILVEH
jgi:hypothetical protein